MNTRYKLQGIDVSNDTIRNIISRFIGSGNPTMGWNITDMDELNDGIVVDDISSSYIYKGGDSTYIATIENHNIDSAFIKSYGNIRFYRVIDDTVDKSICIEYICE